MWHRSHPVFTLPQRNEVQGHLYMWSEIISLSYASSASFVCSHLCAGTDVNGGRFTLQLLNEFKLTQQREVHRPCSALTFDGDGICWRSPEEGGGQRVLSDSFYFCALDLGQLWPEGWNSRPVTQRTSWSLTLPPLCRRRPCRAPLSKAPNLELETGENCSVRKKAELFFFPPFRSLLSCIPSSPHQIIYHKQTEPAGSRGALQSSEFTLQRDHCDKRNQEAAFSFPPHLYNLIHCMSSVS